jgi:hypothetical protein
VERFLSQEQDMIRRKREMLLDHSQIKREHQEP